MQPQVNHPAGSLRVVLTGGIGSGKSEVGRLLARWGAIVVDADQLAREVVEPGTTGLSEVVTEFGDGVLGADGSLNRAALADLVFAAPDRLAVLESIIHPRVEALAAQRMDAAAPGQLVVYEVPLPDRLPGAGVVVVDAPLDVRRRRLQARGLTPEQIEVRLSRQPSRDEWLQRADHVVENGSDLTDLHRQVARLWRQLTGEDPPVGASG
jgi:dephospho-CoA kinase